MGERWTLERAATEKPPGLHPFAGARLRVFLRHALLTPGLDPRTRYQRCIAWLGQILRLPLAAIEKVKYAGAIRRQRFARPPVFLVGHWRSGTTHLHNLMSRDPRFGYLTFTETAMPLDMLGPKVRIARRLIDRALPEDRGFDKVKLALDEPQEEEMALGNLNPIGYYNIYCFPAEMERHRDRALFFEGADERERRRFQRNYAWFLRKVNYAKGGRPLLFKNPPSTTRMPLILESYPEAQFVHIVRNPWEVYASTRQHFARVFHAFAWQSFAEVDLVAYTLETYERLMRRYLADRESLPPGQLVETRYEDVVSDPLGEVRRIYGELGIDAEAEALRAIEDYADGLGGYERNAHRITEAEAAQVRERWGFAFEAWGYGLEPPASVRIVAEA
jgi:hypothetical protein